MKREPIEYTTVNPAYEEGAKMWKIAAFFIVVIVLLTFIS